MMFWTNLKKLIMPVKLSEKPYKPAKNIPMMK